jgi:hypothetical protein
MQLTALNLENVEKKGNPLPSTLTVGGTSIGNGHLKIRARINVLKDVPGLDAGLKLSAINLLALNGFLEANAKFDIQRGNIDIFSRLYLKNSEMNGYVKPFKSELKVFDVKKTLKRKAAF